MTNGHGKYIERKWYDVENPKEEDAMTGDEIAQDIISRAGLILKGNDNESI